MKAVRRKFGLITPIILLVVVWAGLESLLAVFPASPQLKLCFRYNVTGFGLLTVFHLYLGVYARRTNDQKKITGLMLGGMVSHFLLSIGVIILYFYLFYGYMLYEVALSGSFYLMSFLVFIAFGMKLK